MRTYIKLFLSLILSLSLFSCGLFTKKSSGLGHYVPKKREFRAAWLPTIYRNDYKGLSAIEGKNLLRKRVELLHKLGFNALIFQVRPEFDAFYRSDIEPWSRFLSGKQGVAPQGEWDPLSFLVEECHRNGMELHAWINPYRGAANASLPLAHKHLAKRRPYWFVRYDNQLILNPGIPQARKYLCKVVKDIVLRYDIDAIHLDDYFYPYPKKGHRFNDELSFQLYGIPAHYMPNEKAEWRRDNVSRLIRDLKQTLNETKPWVRLGISPFGIYRNKKSDLKGSKTSGLQCYDDLFADVLLWEKNGWVDYIVPQVYWNFGHSVADYKELTKWWSKHIKHHDTHLYIGQHIRRTMNAGQLEQKLLLSQKKTQGNVYWPAEDVLQNVSGVSDSLKKVYQRHYALLPKYKGRLGRTKAPKKLQGVWEDFNEDGHMLLWEDERLSFDPETAFLYIVYAFPKGVRPSRKKSEYIVSMSSENTYLLPRIDGNTPYTFLITSVNRFWQESKPRKIKVKL